MARIAITGGAGFIGSHLTDLLLSLGHEVVVVDNLFTGRKTNFEHNLDNKNFEFIRHDVVFPLYLEVDEVYHLACPASPEHYQYNAIKTIKTNVLGTINMLGLAKRSKASFLLASTSEIYGDPLEHPQKETYWGNVNTVGPRSCYDEGKRIAETLAMNYRVQNNVNTKIVRIFNTYGPRMLFNDGRVVSNFIVQALKGEDITIYGDGTKERDFTYIDDIVRIMITIMNSKRKWNHEIFNIGYGNSISVNEMVDIIINYINPNYNKVTYTGNAEGDVNKTLAVNDKIKEWFNESPKIEIHQGIKKYIDWFKNDCDS